MAKRRKQTGETTDRAGRVKVGPKEALKRMEDFHKRKEQFIASVRKGKN
jgi:hypothetical protein